MVLLTSGEILPRGSLVHAFYTWNILETINRAGKMILSCKPRVPVTTGFVYKGNRDLESIDHLCIKLILRIGLIHK